MPPYSDKTRGDGGIKGNGVAVIWGIGHVLETAPSDAYDEHLKNWSLEILPILPKQWKVLVKPTDAEREGEMSAQADQVSWVMTASYVAMQAQHSIFCQKNAPYTSIRSVRGAPVFTSPFAGALFRVRRLLEALSPENASNKKGVPKDAFSVGLKTTVLES